MFYFHPYLGKWSNLTNKFSNGLVQPPTSKSLMILMVLSRISIATISTFVNHSRQIFVEKMVGGSWILWSWKAWKKMNNFMALALPCFMGFLNQNLALNEVEYLLLGRKYAMYLNLSQFFWWIFYFRSDELPWKKNAAFLWTLRGIPHSPNMALWTGWVSMCFVNSDIFLSLQPNLQSWK